MRICDEIALVEAIYELSTDDTAWAGQLCARLTDHLGADLGAVATLFAPVPGFEHTKSAVPIFSNAYDPLTPLLRETTGTFSQLEATEIQWRAPLFRLHELLPTGHWYIRRFEHRFARLGAADNVSFVPLAGTSHGASFTVFSSRMTRLSRGLESRYRQLSLHLTAAMQLRWGVDVRTLPQTHVDAVFAPCGTCVHRTRGAPGAATMERLAVAVREREQARGSLRRSDPDAALQLWTALVRGRWSLVDRLDHDGRRWILAIRNADGVLDPRALTERELNVVRMAGRGATNCEIAYELGLTEGGVSAHLHAACRKLKCSGRRDLIRLVSRRGESFIVELDGLELGVLSEVESSATHSEGLTHAERAVLGALREGRSDAEISRLRGVSRSTVAKQVASILRKTGRYSRFELMLD